MIDGSEVLKRSYIRVEETYDPKTDTGFKALLDYPYHSHCCVNDCKYMMASRWVCIHPRFIGRDGNGVGLTEMEKEFVKRMGCCRYERK